MKKLTLLIGCLFIGSIVGAQDFKQIVSDITSGEVASVEPLLDEIVDFCFENDQDLLDKAEVSEKLQSTIESIKPGKFEIVHIADSKNSASKYAVATIQSEQGPYRMFVYTENEKIIEIRFNKE